MRVQIFWIILLCLTLFQKIENEPEEEEIVLTDDYNPVAVAAFEEIAALNEGFYLFSWS